MRFTLRSRRGPHLSVGQGGVKAFRREIDRRLDYASHIKYEPKLCRKGISESVAHDYRMLAVDKIAELDDVIASYDSDCVRPAGDDDDDNDDDDDDDDDVGRIQHPVLPHRVSGRASGGL